MIRIAAIRTRVAVIGGLLSWALTAVPAWAHDRPAPVRDLAAASTSDAGGLLLASLAAVIALGLGRRRRLALALAIVLPVLGFEVGLHSTHHVDDPVGAGQCTVAVATIHLSGTPVAPPTLDPSAARAPSPAPPALRVQVRAHRPAPHEGRAPPVSIG
jgi:hypothetical protein